MHKPMKNYKYKLRNKKETKEIIDIHLLKQALIVIKKNEISLLTKNLK